MPRFLSILGRTGSGYLPLTNRTPSSPSSDSTDGIDNEKTVANWGRRWTSIRQFTSISGVLSLLLVLLSTILRCLHLLLPSFAPPLFRRLTRLLSRRNPPPITIFPTPTRRLSATAYLDGLRGIAALIVYLFHFTFIWFPDLGTGYTGVPPNDYFLQRPIIRAFLNGRSSVTIFFIISGFVLPLKTLSEMHKYHVFFSPQASSSKVLESLAGSLIRRPLRLYPPIIVTTALTALLVRIPMFFVVNKPPRMETWQGQLYDWFHREILLTLDLFAAMRINARQGLSYWPHEYNGALWSMMVEFKGSIVVFVFVLVLAGFGRTKRWAGLGVILATGVWQARRGDFDMGLFFAGLLLAEFHVRRTSRALAGNGGKIQTGRWKKWSAAIWHVVTILVLLVGLHFMGYPERQGETTWGYMSMTESDLVPEYYWPVEKKDSKDVDTTLMQQFWISVGSILFVCAVMYSPPARPGWWRPFSSRGTSSGNTVGLPAVSEDDQKEPLLQKPFTTEFAQYMGRISYCFYLCHMGVQNSICWRYRFQIDGMWRKAQEDAAALTKLGFLDESASALGAGRRLWAWYFVWTLAANPIALFWVGDLIYRFVDINTVRMTRRVWAWISS